ncbi:MATE family efflux transporter [Shewanella sp. SR44-3]|uniref:MATE family efflux transporter n=1 Tax=Shewanella sp. SR44-3 TaxID=2760936 RepID=UPI0015F9D093|nr:MATE family efflux transporter [Shewanella sp. SR44-3]MBB1271082.1 MATE family efflux transporter [Shewanella sp. SR44-3]
MTTAKFVDGSIFRHIWVMSSTAAIGISAIFLVDLLDIFFLSLLGEQELAAAVGYAGTISFFTTSIGIGLSIALGALVSKAIGAKDVALAKRLLLNCAIVSFAISVVVALLVGLFVPELLALIGATGHTAELAQGYLYILIPSLPVICLAMALGGALRAVGDAKLSMMSTLAGGGVNAVLDPIFIFLFAMGIEGAALASVLARLTVLIISTHGVLVKHKLTSGLSVSNQNDDLPIVFSIALPAMMTNVATTIGNAVVTRAIADYGDSYVAGWAVLGRLIPVTFGMIFALSGAIGPIVGQNFGANSFDRVRDSLTKAIQFCICYVVVMSLVLFLIKDFIIDAFDMKGDGAALIQFYCQYMAIFFIFAGILFVANASFNNLGKAKYSTLFNAGKATLGTIPFVYFGAQYGGVFGVLIGQAIGSVLFGLAGLWVAYKLVDNIEQSSSAMIGESKGSESKVPGSKAPVEGIELEDVPMGSADLPLSSSCAQLAQLNEPQLCEQLSEDANNESETGIKKA